MWDGWKSRWPWRSALSLGCLEGIRCHQNAQEVSRALSKVWQPQAGAVCSRVVLHISCSSSREETQPAFVPSGVLFLISFCSVAISGRSHPWILLKDNCCLYLCLCTLCTRNKGSVVARGHGWHSWHSQTEGYATDDTSGHTPPHHAETSIHL